MQRTREDVGALAWSGAHPSMRAPERCGIDISSHVQGIRAEGRRTLGRAVGRASLRSSRIGLLCVGPAIVEQ